MAGERSLQGRSTPREQLRLPRRISVQPGDTIEALSIEGIVRITFHENLQTDVETERFPPDRTKKQKLLRRIEKPLEPYISARLTDVGSQRVAPDEIAYPAQVDWKQREEAVKRAINSLLNQGIKREEIENEITGLVLTKGGVLETHMGILPSPLRNILTDLKELVGQVVIQREEMSKKRR
jgi:hypothetical protein